MSAAEALSPHQDRIHALLARRESVDVRAYELAAPEHIVRELQPVSLGLLADTQMLLEDVLTTCEGVSSIRHAVLAGDESANDTRKSYLPFELAVDATVAEEGSPLRAVEEITFLAQLELRQRSERLRRVRPTQGSLVILGECDSSLRRLRKALTAVDTSIAKVGGRPARSDFASELQLSLSVRRAYARFRARLLALGEPNATSLRGHLRLAGTQIAMLIGWREYGEMRVRDRVLVRELQARVLDWLRAGDKASEEDGLHIWQDLAACVDMFALVNRRQELVAHDRDLLARLAREVAGAPGDRPPSSGTLSQLRLLEGLDPALDAALVDPNVTNGAMIPLLQALSHHESPAPANAIAPGW